MKTTTMAVLGCGAGLAVLGVAWWWTGRSALPDVPTPKPSATGAVEVTTAEVALTTKPGTGEGLSAGQTAAMNINTGFVPPTTTDAQRAALQVPTLADGMRTAETVQAVPATAQVAPAPLSLGPLASLGTMGRVLNSIALTTTPAVAPAPTTTTAAPRKVMGIPILMPGLPAATA